MAIGLGGAPADEFTVGDLEGMPDDGHRYELLDGLLVVSPAPVAWHQEAVFVLAMLLRAACPRSLHVLLSPFEWRPTSTTALQPDVLVAHRTDLLAVDGLRHLIAPPVLAVEVLSPSTRRMDRYTKLAVYEEARVPSYWLVDPSPHDPSIRALELRDGHFAEAGVAHGDEEWTAGLPFPVTVRPSALIAGLRG